MNRLLVDNIRPMLADTSNDAFEISMLKSALLFGYDKVRSKRTPFLQKLIMSIIIAGEGNTAQRIRTCIMSRFNQDIEIGVIDSAIKELITNKYIYRSSGETYEALQEKTETWNRNLEKINQDTESLVQNILQKTKENYHDSISVAQEGIIGNNIKVSLSVYYKLMGVDIFETKHALDNMEVLQLARKDLPDKLAEALIYAIGKTLDSPDEKENETLQSWAKAFIATQVMGLDPTLRQFQQTKLSGKSFVLDTDVALHCLVNHTRNSYLYKQLINELIQSNCKIFIPECVVDEVVTHAEVAIRHYNYLNSQNAFSEVSPELVLPKIKNVFVEEYYEANRKVPDSYPTFRSFIRNYYDGDAPKAYMKEVMSSLLPKQIKYEYPIAPTVLNADISILEKERFIQLILEETQKTEKGEFRDDDGNRQIAEHDAELYLTLHKLNEGLSKGSILEYSYYLLTCSVRAMRCAKLMQIDKEIICKPQTIITLLNEIGRFSNSRVSIINLFDNPFLTCTAEIIWEDVQSLLKAGIELKNQNIVRLRRDLDKELHRIMTIRAPAEVVELSKEIGGKGYKYQEPIDKMAAELSVTRTENDSLKEENRRMKEELRKIRNLEKGNLANVIRKRR